MIADSNVSRFSELNTAEGKEKTKKLSPFKKTIAHGYYSLSLIPKFVDVDVNTLNINIEDLKKKVSKKTKAILIVHVLGNCTDMNELMKNY